MNSKQRRTAFYSLTTTRKETPLNRKATQALMADYFFYIEYEEFIE